MSDFNTLVMSLEEVTSGIVNNRTVLKATYHCHHHSEGRLRDPFRIYLSQSPKFTLGENNFDIEVIDDCGIKDHDIATGCRLKGERMLIMGAALIRISDYMRENKIRNAFPIQIVIRGGDGQEKNPDTSSESAPSAEVSIKESCKNHGKSKIDLEEYERLQKKWKGKAITDPKKGGRYNALGVLPVKVNGEWDFVVTYSPIERGQIPEFGRFIPDMEAHFGTGTEE